MYEEFTELSKVEAKEFNRGKESVNWSHRKMLADRVKGTVLEVGCGNGIDASKFDPKLYFGIDISTPLIKLAIEYNPDYKGRFACADASDLIFKNDFDNVIAIGLFEGLPNIDIAKKILKEMIRIARKKVFILWYNAPHTNNTIINRCKGHFGKMCNNNKYNKKELVGDISVLITHFDINYEIWEIDVNGT